MLTKIYRHLLSNHIVIALAIVLFLWLLYQVRFVLALTLLSYIVAVTVLPLTVFLQKKGFPRIAAILTPYSILALILAGGLYYILPIAIQQFQALFAFLPAYVGKLGSLLGDGPQAESLRASLESSVLTITNAFSQSVVTYASKTLEIFVGIASVLVLSVYMLDGYKYLKEQLGYFIENENKDRIFGTLSHIENALSKWLGGQVIVAIIVGMLVWILLTIIGLPYAISLALIAAVLEFVPFIGPVIAIIPAIAVGISQSPTTALLVVLVFISVQLLENNLIVPQVMKYVIRIHPAVIIVAVLIGAELMGILGAILALPTLIIAQIILKNSVAHYRASSTAGSENSK